MFTIGFMVENIQCDFRNAAHFKQGMSSGQKINLPSYLTPVSLVHLVGMRFLYISLTYVMERGR